MAVLHRFYNSDTLGSPRADLGCVLHCWHHELVVLLHRFYCIFVLNLEKVVGAYFMHLFVQTFDASNNLEPCMLITLEKKDSLTLLFGLV